MSKEHAYELTVEWTGNSGTGTSGYRQFERSHTIQAASKPPLLASSDPAFRGDATRYNPEDLLVASLASCHMLWYLHLCAEAGIIVVAYSDTATGIMAETPDGGGHFREVTLHPLVTVAAAHMQAPAAALHERAHQLCFIANSVNFPVRHQPTITIPDAARS
ncbi:OsmC family protein [Hymenobacter chitinivorans]|uniref:Organic hydroperoxide reductase OsmC/OhrA n=1 Tax=Hymenobacter chitinivorans DSM 11115 TaxID=1121954 RepID=A0A2M9AQB0_9BACT|nr:OsmC family protein [Hymenobacter chitinivorans]PJJ47878.1 organic hydroperoxide reductase OsmC/OhrA [Hymenobacter chitinivorans DSM 11115]